MIARRPELSELRWVSDHTLRTVLSPLVRVVKGSTLVHYHTNAPKDIRDMQTRWLSVAQCAVQYSANQISKQENTIKKKNTVKIFIFVALS